MVKRWNLSTVMVLAMLLVSCGVAPPVTDAPGGEPGSPGEQRLRLPPRENTQNARASAVDQLLAEADAAIADQQLNRASALVERAIRVAPQDPRSYFSLAQIRYHQHQMHQVKPLIRKAKSLIVNDKLLLASINKFLLSIAN